MYARRPLAQADAGRLRLPPPLGARQPAAHLRRVRRPHGAADLRLGDPGPLGAGAHRRRDRRADHPSHRPARPGDRGPPGAGAGGRPDRRGAQDRGPQGAGAGHHAHQADGGGADAVPQRARRPRALPAQRHRDPGAGGDPARPAPRRLRRAGRHQPAARGARPAGGLAGGDPRRRQGGLPAQRDLADPDLRPRRPQRQRPGHLLRRPR